MSLLSLDRMAVCCGHSNRFQWSAGRIALGLTWCAASLLAAPTVQRPPADTMVSAGQNATFTVAASGTGTVRYQWRRTGVTMAGATGATLVLGRVTRGEAGLYDVVVSDDTGQTAPAPVRLDVSPRQTPTLLAADPATDLQTEKATGSCRAVAPLPDGGFLVGGSLTSVNGTRRSLIARFTADGTLDARFVPPEIGGVFSNIAAVAVQSDGRIVIGGTFDRVGYLARNGLARLNADGSLDASFAPKLPKPAAVSSVVLLPEGKLLVAAWPTSVLWRLNADGTLDRDLGNRVNGGINAMALQADGKVVLVGPTRSASGSTQGVVRLTREGEVDPDFVAPTYNGVLQTVLIARDGGVLVGGGANFGASTPPVMRLMANGRADPTFTAPNGDGGVYALAELPDGRILVGGSFDQINGTTRRNLMRLTRTGVPDSGYGDPGFTVYGLGVLGSGAVISAGVSNGTTARQPLARHAANGNLEPLWNPTVRSAGDHGGIVQLAGGKFLVLGQFDFARGRGARGVARLNADGTLDPTLDSSAYRAQPYDRIAAAAPLGDGGAVIAGLFTFNPGTLVTPLAVLDAAGLPDPAFSPRASAVTHPETVAVLPDNRIAVGGYADGNADSFGLPGCVAVYNRDGTIDPSFAPSGRFTGAVRSIAAERSGAIIVGGWMSAFNGLGVSALVRLNRDGSLERSFAATGILRSVIQVRVLASGKILATGFQPGGQPVLARFNADGTLDTTFRIIISQEPTWFLPQEDGKTIALLQATSGSSAFVRYESDGSIDPTFRVAGALTVNTYSHPPFFLTDDGNLLFVDGVKGPVRMAIAAAAPAILTAPATQDVAPGGTTTLAATASSLVPFTYQWYFNEQPIAGATSSTYVVTNFQPAQVGTYRVDLTSDLGTTRSAAAALNAPADTSGHLMNLSVRANAGTGDQRLIVGLVLGGANTAGARPLLFRGVGPTLAGFGVSNALADPMLEVYDSNGFKIDQNDDWAGVFDFTSIGSFPFTGGQPKDAAIYNPFATAGAQTFHVAGKGTATGVVLAELYDAAPGQPFTVFTPRITNMSVRTQVGTGDNVLIVGLVIAGQSSQRLLVRAVGPTLAAAPFNLGGTLADPTLELYNAAGVVVATNDNWGSNAAELAPAFRALGAFALSAETSKDAALLATLAPGSYTAVVRGVGGATGVGLVEVYEVK